LHASASFAHCFPVNLIRRALPLLALLAACGTPAVCGGCGSDGGPPIDELPASFRIEAEVVSVTGQSPDLCTPTMADVDPAGPDWELAFERMHDPEEPTFRELAASANGDTAARCQTENLPSGDSDCCTAVMSIDGGWYLECEGSDDNAANRGYFEFTFRVDGSGEAINRRIGKVNPIELCVARVEWSAIVAL
jgi:hypothetical protein